MDLAVGISQHTTGKKKTLPSNRIDYVLQMSFEQIKQTSKQKKNELKEGVIQIKNMAPAWTQDKTRRVWGNSGESTMPTLGNENSTDQSTPKVSPSLHEQETVNVCP